MIYCNAVIKPIIMYASTVWTLYHKEALERVLCMQKRAPHIILEVQLTTLTLTEE